MKNLANVNFTELQEQTFQEEKACKFNRKAMQAKRRNTKQVKISKDKK